MSFEKMTRVPVGASGRNNEEKNMLVGCDRENFNKRQLGETVSEDKHPSGGHFHS